MLDTSALLVHFRQEPGWQEVQAWLEDDEAEVLLASPSLAEFGRRVRELGATEIEVQDFLDSYALVLNGVVTVDATISRDAFVVGCRTPERLPLVDALIAASARAAGCMLVHRDVHMCAIPDGLVHERELAGL